MEEAIAYVRQSTLKQQSLATQNRSLWIPLSNMDGLMWRFMMIRKQVDIQNVQVIKNGRNNYVWKM